MDRVRRKILNLLRSYVQVDTARSSEAQHSRHFFISCEIRDVPVA
jgi:hypothetical protein